MRREKKVLVPTGSSLLARRTGARRPVLLATAVTVFLLSLALSTLVALGIRGPEVAARATLAAASTTDSSVLLSSAPASNTADQDAGVRRVISSVFAGVPITVSRRHLPASGRSAEAFVWTITPNIHRIEVSELGALARAFRTIDSRVDTSAEARSPAAQLSGHGPQTVAEMRVAIAAVGAALPIPMTVLALAGVIALVLCARLLAATRENEARLVRARGGSVGTLVLADVVEMIAPGVIAALLGAAVAQLVLFLTLGAPTGALEVVVAPLGVVVAALILSAVVGLMAARDAHGAPRPAAGRAGVATTLSLAALLVIVSAIALWRFLQYGTPVAGRAEDVSAVLAPALVLCAAAVLSLIVFFPVTGFIQRSSTSRTGFVRVFPARTLHRNPRLFAGPIALVVISVATATMAAGYSATWNGFLTDSTRLVTGSDVRATFGGDALATDSTAVLDSASYRRLHSVADVAPVLRESAMIGDENVTAMGLRADRITSLVGPTSSVLNVPQLQSDLRPAKDPLPGIALPSGTSSLSATLHLSSSTAPSGSVIATLWFADSLGDLAPASTTPQQLARVEAASGSVTVSVGVPTAGPWRIVAVDGTATPTHAVSDFQFGLDSLSARTASGVVPVAIADSASWTPQSGVFNDGISTAGPSGEIGFGRASVRGGSNISVRLMPPGSATVPVVVSRALAQANQLHAGDHVDVEGTWAAFDGRVAGIVPLVPGVTSQASLIGDLSAIDNGWLRSSEQVPALHELWIAGTPSTVVAREVRGVGTARVTTASGSVSRQFVGGAVTGLWLGAAGSAAFAIVTLIASLASQVRRRGREVGVLRALGMAARDQARMRRIEIAVVLVFGLVVGALVGIALLTLTVGTLARSSTPEAPGVLPLTLQFDFLTPLALVGGIALVSILVVWRYLAIVAAAAKVARP